MDRQTHRAPEARADAQVTSLPTAESRSINNAEFKKKRALCALCKSFMWFRYFNAQQHG